MPPLASLIQLHTHAPLVTLRPHETLLRTGNFYLPVPEAGPTDALHPPSRCLWGLVLRDDVTQGSRHKLTI